MVVLVGALFAAPGAFADLYTVNSAADDGDGVCDVLSCTLRDAIENANASAGVPDDILFHIGVGGSQTISPVSQLPDITDPVTVDGTSQTGYAGAPLIELDGGLSGGNGLVVSGTTGVTIRGLGIGNFVLGVALGAPGSATVVGNYIGIDAGGSVEKSNSIGIAVSSGGNSIGGTTAADRNIVSGNNIAGIEIASGANNNVRGNYVGTDASGNVPVPNGLGINVAANGNTIGSAGDGRNLVSGNTGVGIEIAEADSNTVEGNYVGTNADGTSAVANMNGGVYVTGTTGSPAIGNAISENVISGNEAFGVQIAATNPDAVGDTEIDLNLIGTTPSGDEPLGNAGPGVQITQDGGDGFANVLENTIAYNTKGIVAETGTARNTFTSNSIHDNIGIGIDLGDDDVTQNDTDDADTGANTLVNFPEPETVDRNANGTVTVTGSYPGAPGGPVPHQLEFFASPSCDGSGFGEGETFLGSINIPVTGNTPFDTGTSLSEVVAPGSYITATATDEEGNTSEFSECLLVEVPTLTRTVNTDDDVDDGTCDASHCSLREAMDDANATPMTEAVTIDFAIPDPPPFLISLTTELPPITHDVVIDATTQPGFAGAPLVQLDGSDVLPLNGSGLLVDGGLNGSTIRGLSITGFSTAGITLNGPPSLVEGNYVGLTPSGFAIANGSGSLGAGIIVNSGGNRVGGTTAAARNVISGNHDQGVTFEGGTGSVVLGNYIGTNPAGDAAVPNAGNGVGFEDARAQIVGGTAVGAGNLISGNGANGVFVNSGFAIVGDQPFRFEGNTIGLAADGVTALPNTGAGVLIAGISDTDVRVGGSVAGAGNVIAGNGFTGVAVQDAAQFSTTVRIQGNLIGLDASGDSGVPNGSGAVTVLNSEEVLIGGTTAGARNVISGGPSSTGVIVDSGSDGVTIQGNYIGTDVTGEAAIGGSSGVQVGAAQNVTIGGVVPGAGNVISGHSGRGVQVDLAGTGNRVVGNSIGTDKDETDMISNDIGIELDGMTGAIVADNVIAGSLDVGILVFVGSDANVFAGNFVGTDRTETFALGNGDGMRFANGGGNGNVVGPGNVFAFNVDRGIELDQGTGNRISESTFHDNGQEAIFLDAGGNANNNQAAPVLTTAAKSGSTTAIDGSLTSTPTTDFAIEFFATPTCSGQPQGQTYLGTTTVTTDVAGNAPIAFASDTPAVGDFITATAANLATGDTSQFSSCLAVAADASQVTTTVTAEQPSTVAGGVNAIGVEFDNPLPIPVTLDSITATLPAGLFYVRNSAEIDGTFVGPFLPQPPATGTLTWNGSFTLPASGTLSMRFEIGAGTATGSYVVSATAAAAGGVPVTTDDDSVTVVGALGGSLVLPAEADTYVDAVNPTTNFGTLDSFVTYGGTNTGPQYGLLRFDLGALPAGATVTSARLRLVGFDGFAFDGDPFHHALFIVDDSWTETGVTWDTKPADGTPGSLGTAAELGQDIVFYGGFGGLGDQLHLFPGPNTAPDNLGQRVTTEAAGDDKLSIELFNACCGPGNTGYLASYYSREAADPDLRPELVLTFAFTVNTADDADDGACDLTHCSLREAINAANAASGPDTIEFAIPGPHTIQPGSPLPGVTDPVTIDGTSQSGYAGSPVIQLDGALLGAGANGLVLAGSEGSVVDALAISGFSGAGLRIFSDGNTVRSSVIGRTGSFAPNFVGIAITGSDDNVIGGPGGRNVISDNDDAGVLVDGTVFGGADGNTIAGNYIGLDATGATADGNRGPGVWVIGATNTTIGGPPGDGNAFAANFNDVMLGDFVAMTPGNHTIVANNTMGLSANGTANFTNSGNGVEVMDAGDNTIIGNTIASTYQGIDICGSSNNTVVRNLIGTNALMVEEMGVFNQGISIFGGPCPFTAPATGNVIGGAPGSGNTVLNSSLNGIAADADSNTVSHNTVSNTQLGGAIQVDGNSNAIGPGNVITGNQREGVLVDGGTGNLIRQNSIDVNGRLGIDLSGATDLLNGITPNDAGDTDTGPNDLQNYPVVASAVRAATTTDVTFDFDSLPGDYVLEFFGSPSCDPFGNGEGATLLTQLPLNISSAVTGQVFTLGSARPVGSAVTMTATDSLNNTSEFSNCVTVAAAPQAGPYFVNNNDDHNDGTCDFGDCTLREAIIAANANPGSSIFFSLPASTTISPTTNLPTIDVPTTIDATTQPGYLGSPLVVLSGSAVVESGPGLELLAGGSTVRGLVIVSWDGGGVALDEGDGNTVAGNYIGVGADGETLSQNNGGGVVILPTSDGNTIGGTGPNDRNVISGNGGNGVDIGFDETFSSDGNTVAGNLIGLLPDGTGTAGVTGNFFDGVVVGGDNNTIGGTTAAARNYIAANGGPGVRLQGAGNVVKGNTIGLAAATDTALANAGCGIEVNPTDSAQAANTIGDTGGGGNVLSGNSFEGVCVSNVTASPGTVIAGNLIGTDETGTLARGNNNDGIDANGAANTQIVGNVISGNAGAGVNLRGVGATGTVLEGNTIGLDAAGAAAVANLSGVLVQSNATGTTIGGTVPAARNVISGNVGAGIIIDTASDNEVLGNLIGTNAAGTQSHGNGVGIRVRFSNNTTIGGDSANEPNVIAGSDSDAVVIEMDSGSTLLEGNFIGTDEAATLALGNSGDGVTVTSLAHDTILHENTIRNSGGVGVAVTDPSLGTTISANSIDDNTGLGIDLATAGVTANDAPDTDHAQNFPILTSVSPVSVSGTLASLPDTEYVIEVFDSPTCDASGNGEGRTYVGATSLTTNAAGNGTFTATVTGVTGGHAVTATATDPNGHTSEFSECVTVEAAIATNLSLTATPTSAPAGAARVKLTNVSPTALLQPQSSQQPSPVNQTPVNQTPVNQTAATSAPVNQTPVNQTPVNQTPVNQTGVSGFAELTQTVPALGSISISSIPVLRPGGWAAILAGTTLAGIPEQNVTLKNVYALTFPIGSPLAPNSTNPLTLADLDLSRTTIGRMPAMAFALGTLPLSSIPVAPTGTYTTWCQAALAPGIDCGATSSVLSAGLQGAPVNQTPVNQTPVNQTLINALAANFTPVNQTPVNQTPVNQTRIGALPVNQTPVNQTPVNQTPVNQTSLQAILIAQGPVNQTPVNQTPVNQTTAGQTVINCTAFNCSTGTLGQAFAAGAVDPNATLGDLRRALPESALANWTIADLRDFAVVVSTTPTLVTRPMTIGELLASLPQPNSFTLADVLLLVLGSPNAQGLSFESLNLFDTGLPAIAEGGSTIDYRAQFDVQANGGPTGVPETVMVRSTLPSSFLYVAGSSKLTPAAGTCGAATLTGDPTTTTLADGRLRLTWTVPVIVGNGYAVCFTGRPGIILGPQGATLTAQPTGAPVASATPASVAIGDTLEPNEAPGTAPQILTDSFYLSYLTSSSDIDYARFPTPPAGTMMTFHLSHLPSDYDLVVYGPPQTQLRPPVISAVPLDVPPVTDGGVDPTHATDGIASQTLDDLRLQPDLPLVGVSAMRGTDPEDIVVLSPGGGGFFTVQVTGYNGATSPKPYMLRVSTTPPRVVSNVPSRTGAGTVGPALPNNLPAGLNTVFLVNRQQLQARFNSTRASNVMTALANTSASFRTLGFPNVVLSVERFASVQTAYAAWNANPGSPAAANGVVQAINRVVDSEIRAKPNGGGLKYLVIVGGDQVIPMARLDDFTVTASNESGYASTFGTNTDLFAAFNAGQMLSDDPYGDVNPVPYLNRQLYIPELAVGRLVETPEDIIATLNRFVAPTVQGHLDPSTSLTTGYDFLRDGANEVNTALRTRVGGTNPAGLIGNSWTLQNLIDAFLPTAGAPSLTSLNGHASHYQFEPPALATGTTRGPLFTTSALTGSSSSTTNRLVFSMGCHAGLPVPDATVMAGGAPTLDWPQAYAQKGAGAYLGNTGYGYGDSLVVAYSEQLNKLFAQRIAAGSTVGNALVAAKQGYYGGLGVFGVYDEKSMAEFTLFGLPMWSVSGPGNAPAPASLMDLQTLQAQESSESAAGPSAAALTTADPIQPLAIVPDPPTGLQAETFDVAPNNVSTTMTEGTHWSAQDGEQVTHLRPIQPKLFVPLTGTTAHGALITGLTSSNTDCVNPVFARPLVDLGLNESELAFGDVAFPSKLQTVRTFVTPTGLQQRVVLVTGQFFTRSCATDPDPQVGVQRLFDRIAGRAFRSSSTDYIPPAFRLINATKVGGNAAFAVDVTDLTPTGPGVVKQVLVGVRSGSDSVWKFVDLVQSASNQTRWTGGLPVAEPEFEYFVQAVDAAGNVAVSTNKGFYYKGAPAPPPPAPGHVAGTLAGSTADGWYTGAPELLIDKPDGVTVEASVDGGPFGPPPTFITGDGFHTIDLRGSNGDTQQLFAAVDMTAPEIVIGTPANGGVYTLNSIVPADYTCRDSGSGVVTPCTGHQGSVTGPVVPSGANIDTSSVGTKSFTVEGVTDATGKSTPDKTVTYTVGYRPILFTSSRTAGGDIYSINENGTGLTRLTNGAGIDEQASLSPDGSKIAFASKRNDQNGTLLDIYVMDANGQNLTRLTTAKDDDTAPSWSPDGRKIAFSSRRDGNTEIYTMNADGSGQTRLTFVPNQDTEPAWSPNGQKIVFSSNRSMSGWHIWMMNADGSAQTQLTTPNQQERGPAWSPDGTLIAFSSKRTGDPTSAGVDIWVMSPTGANLVRVASATGDDLDPSWSRDGSKIVFSAQRNGNPEIYVMNADGTGATRLTSFSGPDTQPDW